MGNGKLVYIINIHFHVILQKGVKHYIHDCTKKTQKYYIIMILYLCLSCDLSDLSVMTLCSMSPHVRSLSASSSELPPDE